MPSRNGLARATDGVPRFFATQGMSSAVAIGAAYYGRVRRGTGLRVKAGSARTYYIGMRSEHGIKAVCVLPSGTNEGTTLPLLDREFSVLANRPVSFHLYSSTVRHDAHGAIADLDAGRGASSRALGHLAALWQEAPADGTGRAPVRQLHGSRHARTLVRVRELIAPLATAVRIATRCQRSDQIGALTGN